MEKVTVSVNGVPVEKYLAEQKSIEKSREISQFLRDEFRSMHNSCRHHSVSGSGCRNTSKVTDVGNGSIRCK